MRLTIAAIGRLRSGPEFELAEDYSARIRAAGKALGITHFTIKEFDAPKGLFGPQRQEREAALLADATNVAKRIVLDEHGENLTSEAFAVQIAKWRDQGATEIAFLVGGADGHHPSIIASADLVVAFGKATFPRLLVRVMLAEQIYRAVTILAGHPYHRA
ncbi:MAG: 23S rRNA (pseudouridine(1915)-N(3))-methyltransferase RlmH [Pseudomonadota bacterium]